MNSSGAKPRDEAFAWRRPHLRRNVPWDVIIRNKLHEATQSNLRVPVSRAELMSHACNNMGRCGNNPCNTDVCGCGTSSTRKWPMVAENENTTIMHGNQINMYILCFDFSNRSFHVSHNTRCLKYFSGRLWIILAFLHGTGTPIYHCCTCIWCST